VFDEDNLVSCAGLVPVMALAEQAGLSELLANKIHIAAPRVKSGSANPAPKLATLIASMCAGADYIDDVDLVRAGGMKTLFERVYAPSTVGTLTWSTSPPAWPDLNANRSFTYPPTGPGNLPGSPCGTTPSADDPAPNHHIPDPTTRTPTGKAGQTSGSPTPATSHNQDEPLNPPTRGRSVESGLGISIHSRDVWKPRD